MRLTKRNMIGGSKLYKYVIHREKHQRYREGQDYKHSKQYLDRKNKKPEEIGVVGGTALFIIFLVLLKLFL